MGKYYLKSGLIVEVQLGSYQLLALCQIYIQLSSRLVADAQAIIVYVRGPGFKQENINNISHYYCGGRLFCEISYKFIVH